MKSPLKELKCLKSSRSHLLRPMKVNEEELDVFFGSDFVKHAGSRNDADSLTLSEPHDAAAAQLQEWNAFSSFDPINDISVGSGAPLLRKRVNFATDENREVLRTEYSCVKTIDVRETWYGASDFRQFRARCHETAAIAILDIDYRHYFYDLYASCCADTGIPLVDAEDALEFAKYRGLERVIFRKELQTDKIASIQGVVWSQNDARMPSDDMLADESFRLTASARNMAQYHAAADFVIAQHTPGTERRFIEI